VRIVGTNQDITERKLTELALRQSEERFSKAFWASPDAISILRVADGTIVDVNEAGASLFGYTRDEVLGSSTLNLVWPSADGRNAVLAELSKHGRVKNWFARLKRKDGTLFPVEMSIELVSLNKEAHTLSVVRDVSERELARELLEEANRTLEARVIERTAELAAANERLRELDRLKSEFLAMMSHELRTPLNSIIGFTGLLSMELPGPINDEQKKQLGLVTNSARHLLNLINGLLDLSRIESGRMDVWWETYDLSELLTRAIATMRPQAQEKGLDLSLDAPDPLHIEGDQKKTYQILLNLLSNAIKFTSKGGVRVVVSVSAASVFVYVADTGMGMSDQSLIRLFEAFSQVDGSARRAHEGSGLGLHLSRRLARLMGGDVTVRSQLAVGSTFTLHVPRARPLASEATDDGS
jgi:PAS domain S-box-containing protein